MISIICIIFFFIVGISQQGSWEWGMLPDCEQCRTEVDKYKVFYAFKPIDQAQPKIDEYCEDHLTNNSSGVHLPPDEFFCHYLSSQNETDVSVIQHRLQQIITSHQTCSEICAILNKEC